MEILLCMPEWLQAFIDWINTPEVVSMIKKILMGLGFSIPSITAIIGVVVSVIKGEKSFKALYDELYGSNMLKDLEFKLKNTIEENAQLKQMIADLLTEIKGIRVKVEDYEKERNEQSNKGL